MITPVDSLSDLQEKETTNRTAEPNKERLAARRRNLIEYFRGFMAETFDHLHVASEEETNRLREGLLHIGLTEEEISGWEDYRDSVAERQRSSARSLASQLHSQLSSANEAHLITRESKQRWLDRFSDPSLGYKAKEYFVQHQLPSYIAAWQKVAQKRIQLLRDPRFASLTAEDIGELETFKRGKDYLDLHFEKRADLNARIEGALLAKGRNVEHLFDKAKSLLETAASAGAINRDTVGRMLLGRLKKFQNAASLQHYTENQLPEYIKNWVKLRTEFDWVEAKMKETSVPQGFNRLTPEKFLLLSYAQRKSYIEQAKQRLNLSEAPSSSAMENLKLGIRHALDTKDWEEAQILLKEARGLLSKKGTSAEKDRFELDSMERNLLAFRTDEKEKQHPMDTPQQTIEQMRTALAQVPPSLQPLYLSAVNDPEKMGAVAACTYNRVWCREHGYLNDDREKELEKQATESTQSLAKQGQHSKKGLDNVKLGVVTDQQHDPAVRRYADGEWAPTIIHMPPGTSQHFNSILETRKGNHSFRYWTTLIPTDIPYEQQLHLVRNVNWVLKSGTRKLKEQGVNFSLADRAPEKEPPKKAQEAQHALAA